MRWNRAADQEDGCPTAAVVKNVAHVIAPFSYENCFSLYNGHI
jgi:hypothetical protein